METTIVEDSTGVKSQLPVLFTEQGELSSVTDYLLKLEADGISASVIKGFLQAVSLLIDYMKPISLFSEPKILSRHLPNACIAERLVRMVLILQGFTGFLAQQTM